MYTNKPLQLVKVNTASALLCQLSMEVANFVTSLHFITLFEMSHFKHVPGLTTEISKAQEPDLLSLLRRHFLRPEQVRSHLNQRLVLIHQATWRQIPSKASIFSPKTKSSVSICLC